MKRIYEVQVYFDYPDKFFGMRHCETYRVTAASLRTAAKLGQTLANRDKNGGYAPRTQRVEEVGVLDAHV